MDEDFELASYAQTKQAILQNAVQSDVIERLLLVLKNFDFLLRSLTQSNPC